MEAYTATVMQTPSPTTTQVEQVVIGVHGGEIVARHPAGSEGARATVANAAQHHDIGPDAVMIPGLVDLHIHAPQWLQLGTALDLPVEEWLFAYTFPLESRFADLAFATTVYDDLVTTLLAHGTTSAVYFASVHEPATVALAQACVDHGQRALVGRVAMDHPDGTPDYYRDLDADAGLAASARSITDIRAVAASTAGRVEPIITPRFIPACTDELLSGLGRLAAETGVRVQTHCSESNWHHQYAFDRFGVSDTTALQQFGLLADRTVLAHSNLVEPDDLATIAHHGGVVAHCPVSNSYFANAVFPVTRGLDAGIHIGMGTDIGAGVHPGVLQQCNDAATVSRMLQDGVDSRVHADARGVPGSSISSTTAFWMATLGGADGAGLPVGLLDVGRRFDAVVIDLARAGGIIRRVPDIDINDRLFEKVIRLTRPDDIAAVYVDGRLVHGTPTQHHQQP